MVQSLLVPGFAVPAKDTFGNLGRDSLRSDWNKNLGPIALSTILFYRTLPYGVSVRDVQCDEYSGVGRAGHKSGELNFRKVTHAANVASTATVRAQALLLSARNQALREQGPRSEAGAAQLKDQPYPPLACRHWTFPCTSRIILSRRQLYGFQRVQTWWPQVHTAQS